MVLRKGLLSDLITMRSFGQVMNALFPVESHEFLLFVGERRLCLTYSGRVDDI